MNVPVGSTTKVGWGAAATAFAAALIAYLTGDHTAQSVTAVELAAGGLVLLAITHGFRYLQALVGIKAEAPVDELAPGTALAERTALPPDGVDSAQVARATLPQGDSQ